MSDCESSRWGSLTRILRLQSLIRISAAKTFHARNFAKNNSGESHLKRKNWNCWRYLMRVTRIIYEKIFAGFSPCSGIYASHRVSVAKACFSRNFVKVLVRETQNNLEVINLKWIKQRAKAFERKFNLINSLLVESCELLKVFLINLQSSPSQSCFLIQL